MDDGHYLPTAQPRQYVLRLDTCGHAILGSMAHSLHAWLSGLPAVFM